MIHIYFFLFDLLDDLFSVARHFNAFSHLVSMWSFQVIFSLKVIPSWVCFVTRFKFWPFRIKFGHTGLFNFLENIMYSVLEGLKFISHLFDQLERVSKSLFNLSNCTDMSDIPSNNDVSSAKRYISLFMFSITSLLRWKACTVAVTGSVKFLTGKDEMKTVFNKTINLLYSQKQHYSQPELPNDIYNIWQYSNIKPDLLSI